MKKAGWIVVIAALIALPLAVFWPRKAETDVSQVRRVVGLSLFGRAEEGLVLLHSLRATREIDGPFSVRLEVAVRLAMLADQYDVWEGSDFGRATPWVTDFDTWDEKAFDEKDCDRVIHHSLNRLRDVAFRKLKEQAP